MQTTVNVTFRADAPKPATFGGGVLQRILMDSNGREAFVMNLRANEAGGTPHADSVKKLHDATSQLLLNGGRFFCLYGDFSDPFSLLDYMEDKGRHFIKPAAAKGLQVMQFNGLTDDFAPIYEVGGNLVEESGAFRYRFYCAETYKTWLTRANRLVTNRTD